MPKIVHFGEFLKIWSLRSNSVTRQVSFNRTNLVENAKNSNATFWVIFKQCEYATFPVFDALFFYFSSCGILKWFLARFGASNAHMDDGLERCDCLLVLPLLFSSFLLWSQIRRVSFVWETNTQQAMEQTWSLGYLRKRPRALSKRASRYRLQMSNVRPFFRHFLTIGLG